MLLVKAGLSGDLIISTINSLPGAYRTALSHWFTWANKGVAGSAKFRG
jgi:hypothetical protein